MDFAFDARSLELREQHMETGLKREGDRIRIRFAADSVDHSDARSVQPTLEDAYLWLMREGIHRSAPRADRPSV